MGNGLSHIPNKIPEHSYKHQVLLDRSDPHVPAEKLEKFRKDIDRIDRIKTLAPIIANTGAAIALTSGMIAGVSGYIGIFTTAIYLSTSSAAAAGAVTAAGAAVVAAPIAIAAIPIGLTITGLVVAGIGLAILIPAAITIDVTRENHEKYRFINPFDKNTLLKDVLSEDETIQNNRLMNLPEYMRNNFVNFKNDIKKLQNEFLKIKTKRENEITGLQNNLTKNQNKILELKQSIANAKQGLMNDLRHQLRIAVKNYNEDKDHDLSKRLTDALQLLKTDALQLLKEGKPVTLEDAEGKFILEDLDSTVKTKIQTQLKLINSTSSEIQTLTTYIDKLKDTIKAKKNTYQTEQKTLQNAYTTKHQNFLDKFSDEAFILYQSQLKDDEQGMKKQAYLNTLQNQINLSNYAKRIMLFEKLIVSPQSIKISQY